MAEEILPMTTRMSQDALGRCDFLDVLEEAAVRRTPVAVQLRAGETFIDTVKDVVTEAGDDYAVFAQHPRVPVGEISAVTRAEVR
jgi:Rho-binding antiterminator